MNNLKLPEAAARLAGEATPAAHHSTSVSQAPEMGGLVPAELIQEWVEELWNRPDRSPMHYLTVKRGIGCGVLLDFKIGFNSHNKYQPFADTRIQQGIVMPRGNGIKVRGGDGSYRAYGKPDKFYALNTATNYEVVFLLESELDVLLCRTAMPGVGTIAHSIPASGAFNEDILKNFLNVQRIVVALDFDEAGETDAAKLLMYRGFYRCAPLPDGCKDVGDYYAKINDIEGIAEWMWNSLPRD